MEGWILLNVDQDGALKLPTIPRLCEDLLDAVEHGRGPHLCRARGEGRPTDEDGSLGAQEIFHEMKPPEVLRRIFVGEELLAFAAECAVSALATWDAPQSVRAYLVGGKRGIDYEALNAATDAATAGAGEGAWAAMDAIFALGREASDEATWLAVGSVARKSLAAISPAAGALGDDPDCSRWKEARRGQRDRLEALLRASGALAPR
jgi:hypothetical protein